MTNFAAPRKSLGQNFLQDPNIINKIVAGLNVNEKDIVVEIGPGRGALTDLILPLASKLHLVEFDYDLVRFWEQKSDSLPQLQVHGVDVLKFDFNTIIEASNKPLKIIGNLPYNISSPVLFHLMKYADHIHSQVVMLQKEVVERMASLPFSQRRKTLRNTLKKLLSSEQIESVGVEPSARAETLSVKDFAALSNLYSQSL